MDKKTLQALKDYIDARIDEKTDQTSDIGVVLRRMGLEEELDARILTPGRAD